MSIRTDRVRLAILLKKKQDLTNEEFLNYWLNSHAKLFTSLEIVKKNLVKYEQVLSYAFISPKEYTC